MKDNKHTVLTFPNLNMEARLIPNDVEIYGGECGYANGYVGVNKDHPLYGVEYNEIFSKISIHGGLTYSGHIKNRKHNPTQVNWVDEDLWWFGFDTFHSGDRIDYLSKDYCLREVAYLACQIASFSKTKQTVNEKE